MKLLNLKVEGIRGFNTKAEISLDENLTIIYGPNGQGKTSFVEAIEWVLFGTIFKKERALSKNEFKETIKNIHYKGETPYIEAYVRKDELITKLRREYVNEEDSILYINDKKVENICDLGICDTIKPIIYQHGLKSFIQTKPKERYLEFMKLLNLDDLDSFLFKVKQTLKEYKRNKPEKIRNAILFFDLIHHELDDYYSYIEEKNMNIDMLELANKINEELKIYDRKIKTEDLKDFIVELNILNEKVRKDIFDLDLFSAVLSFKPIEVSPIFDLSNIDTAVNFLTTPTNIKSINQIDVLNVGLKIIQSMDSKICPLCFEETINTEKIDFIASKFEEYNRLKDELNRCKKLISDYLSNFEEFKSNTLQRLSNLGFSKELVKSIKGFEVDEQKLKIIIDKNSELIEIIKRIKSIFDSLVKILKDLATKDAEQLKQTFSNYKTSLEGLKKDIFKLNGLTGDFSQEVKELKKILEKKIVSSDKVRRIERIYSLLNQFDYFKLYQLDKGMEDRLNSSVENLQKFRDGILKDTLAEHKVEIMRWYDILNPDEEIRICDIDSRGDKISFIAESYGLKKEAVPILSEAHLNCLGLSIYLSKILNEANPFSFILIDDPVQSMDEAHTDNFINEVIQKLIDKDFQIFVFSHLSTQVVSLIMKRYEENFPTYLEFYGYCLEGPKFKIKKSNDFENYISVAEQNYNGDKEQRKNSANMVRQALECYVKQYFCKKSNSELPSSYKDATFTELDTKLLSRVEINPTERGKLRLINAKCDKRSHDDQSFEPPISQELRSHIDILKGLFKKHIKGIKDA